MPKQDEVKNELFPLLLEASALTFGTYTLKSGRVSPYFFTSSLLHTSALLASVARAYATVLTSPPFSIPSAVSDTTDCAVAQGHEPTYDILFGPAYKGIPISAIVTRELEHSGAPYSNVSYAFNRKEAKDHGEGGIIVGAPLKDKRVVIIDDVMTAGTALREAVSIIQAQGGIVVGVVLLLTRQERVSETESRSAMQVAQDELGVPVRAVLTFEDIMDAVERGDIKGAGPEQFEQMRVYREKYGSKDFEERTAGQATR
ncbi:orotate phosphoribosyltransferase [Lithohypha guttulata]|uniref:Orotate phosphoribosyltransferase n=1 Tax=Lithohypha guttulata TaxID=1690604 RepID=A0AAN7SVT9_9EURO|nr:orotate phosphoribosyltransferase [Lithohypha guttulata]KAK5082416.1 orotate phosphoribosyltransferase [Lithohypha guttulata]KAK5105149.1 orotate phosphoribosyltransferase [Lithohypha guttulata]